MYGRHGLASCYEFRKSPLPSPFLLFWKKSIWKKVHIIDLSWIGLARIQNLYLALRVAFGVTLPSRYGMGCNKSCFVQPVT